MDHNIHVSEQVLQQIEWDSIKTIVSGYNHFSLNFDNIFSYLSSKENIEFKLIETNKFYEYLYDQEFSTMVQAFYAINPEMDFKKSISAIRKEHALEFNVLNQIILSCEQYLSNSKLLKNYFPEFKITEDIQTFKRKIQKSILSEFRKFISVDGTIDLAKHPLLRPLFEKQLALEANIRGKLDHLLNDSELQKKIQFSTIDVINDRYVIPIKSDSFNHKMGQIISRSETGNTLYIEPSAITQMNFDRLHLVVQIQSILSKLELDYTLRLKEFLNEINEISKLILYIDEYNTRSLFAKDLKLSFPEITKDKKINIKGGFHPLIENPVKNDISIDSKSNGLVISGPNTGGKTATLKFLALTQLFLRYGFYIPCDGGEIFIYDKIYYFGNDGQDLNSGLSSFSAEVKNYTSLFSKFENSNLILIDEIFNSTSSEEASALAIALFKKIHEVTDAHIIVSSHHQTLKTILHQDESYISAHVGFNTDNNTPTYHLHYGSPGSSHALRIFKSLTKDLGEFSNVYENALKFLDNKVIHYEKLLESISEKEHQISKTLSENKALNSQLKNQKEAMEGVIKLKIEERVDGTEKKLKKIIDKAEYILRETKRGNIQKTKQLDKHQHEMSAEIAKFQKKKPEVNLEEKYSNLTAPKTVVIGQDYFCLTLQKTVKVKKIDKSYAHIGTGNFSMKVPIKTLRIANSTDTSPSVNINAVQKSRASQVEYDCRGMRLEEFQSLTEEIISDLLLGDVPFVNIIHGHGNGILKNWLRGHIKKQKDIQIVKENTGNDGDTKLSLK